VLTGPSWFGLFSIFRVANQLNKPKKPDEPNKRDRPAPATRRRMCDYKTWTHFLGAAMFMPGA
jgi:hypothetical protein